MSRKLILIFFVVCICVAVYGKPAARSRDDNTPTKSSCQLPMVKGICRALMRRWGYDPKVKDCVKFEYGGCLGNANNFDSRKECLEMCKGV